MKKVSIFILIDALGWTYIKNRPFLNNIAKTKRPVKSLFGYSSAILPSILTGKYPDEHKHWSLFYHNPEDSLFKWVKTISWFPKRWLNSRLGRKIVEVISQKKAGYTGYFETYLIPVELLPHFDICEKKSIYKPGGFIDCQSIFDIWQEKGIKYTCLTYPNSDKEIFQLARDKIKNEDTGVYFLYFADLDAFLHKHCQNKEWVNEKLDWYEREIGELVQIAAGRWPLVDLYIFSDHGMTPTEKTFDLKGEIDKLGLKVHQDYLAIYDSTMARFWFFNDRAKSQITGMLNGNKNGRVLTDKELKEWRVYFPDKRYGEIIYLMNSGSLINPSFMGNTPPRGMHGFSPETDTADGVLVSNVDITADIKDVTGFFKLMEGVGG